MAGLRLMGNIGAYAGPGTQPPASTAAEAAFGNGYSSAPDAGTGAALSPSHPAGLAFWAGVASVGGLVFVRHSLPAGARSNFDMVLMMLVLWGPAKALARTSLQRLAQEPQTTGAIDTAARAGVYVLS